MGLNAWTADKNSRHVTNLRNKNKNGERKWKRERKEKKNRNGRDYLEAQRNKEPLRDHEGNIEWKDPFKSGN